MPTHIEVRKLRHTQTGDVYRLRFEGTNNIYQVYVEECPPNPQSQLSINTHILAGNQLCFTTSPEGLEQALGYAIKWIYYYSNYIRTGDTTQKPLRITINNP